MTDKLNLLDEAIGREKHGHTAHSNAVVWYGIAKFPVLLFCDWIILCIPFYKSVHISPAPMHALALLLTDWLTAGSGAWAYAEGAAGWVWAADYTVPWTNGPKWRIAASSTTRGREIGQEVEAESVHYNAIQPIVNKYSRLAIITRSSYCVNISGDMMYLLHIDWHWREAWLLNSDSMMWQSRMHWAVWDLLERMQYPLGLADSKKYEDLCLLSSWSMPARESTIDTISLFQDSLYVRMAFIVRYTNA